MRNRKKVLFITGYFPFRPGGAEYQALLLAEQLKQEFDISFVFRNHWNKNERINDRGYTLFATKPFRTRGMNNTFIFESLQLRSILKEVKPDFIYIRGANAFCITAAFYANRNNCRTIWHIAHDRDLIPFNYKNIVSSPFSLVEKKMVEYGLMNSDCIIAQTHHQAELLKKNYKKRCENIIGNWHPIPPIPVKQNSMINVLWIANWRPFKQPELFIRLVQQIKFFPHVRFIMIGRNNGYPEIKAQAIANKIQLTGEIPNADVNTLLSKSHLLINTSQMEGFSNTFIQAWMQKVPVVSLQVDPDNILQKMETGFCSKNFANLVKNTELLLSNHKLRKEMGQKARNYAIQNHSLENIDKVISIFTK